MSLVAAALRECESCEWSHEKYGSEFLIRAKCVDSTMLDQAGEYGFKYCGFCGNPIVWNEASIVNSRDYAYLSGKRTTP